MYLLDITTFNKILVKFFFSRSVSPLSNADVNRVLCLPPQVTYNYILLLNNKKFNLHLTVTTIFVCYNFDCFFSIKFKKED